MKREDISRIFEGATDAQINEILNIHSAGIGKAKGDYETLKTDLKTARDTVTTLTTELSGLKEQNASSEDWKKRFEELQSEIEKKEDEAKKKALADEKAANISKRFDTAVGDRKFSHDAIKADYLRKFGEALDLETNAGKSDTDIFTELTRDDGAAFENVTMLNLPGRKPLPGGDDDSAARAVMGLK